MQVTISFSTDNASFDDGGFDSEVLHVLHAAARKLDRLDADTPSLPLHDSNGNTIGTVSVSADEN